MVQHDSIERAVHKGDLVPPRLLWQRKIHRQAAVRTHRIPDQGIQGLPSQLVGKNGRKAVKQGHAYRSFASIARVWLPAGRTDLTS